MALLHFQCIGQVSTMSWLIADIFWTLKTIDMSRQEDFKQAAYNNDRESSKTEQQFFIEGCEYGYQYAVDKAFDVLSQMLYTKRDDEHPAQHYTRSVESMGKFVSQTDFLNQFKQFMEE